MRAFICKYGVFVFAILVSLLAINSWSLWTDESSTAFLAMHESLSELMTTLESWKGSESQMPGYVVTMFIWEKLFGHSEYALRSFNLFMIGVLVLYLLWKQSNSYLADDDKKKARCFVLLTFLSPMIVYNINEARVNITIFVLGTISLASAYLYCRYKKNTDWIILILSVILGYSFNFLYIVIGLPMIILIFYRDWRIIKHNWKSLLLLFILISLISFYYIQTLLGGHGGMKERPGFLNIGYTLYEFMGFGGMSVPKNELRNGSLCYSVFEPYIIPTLLLLMAYCGMVYVFIKEKVRYHTVGLFVISVLGFYLLAYVAEFRFLGRHLLMLYPLFLYSLADAIVSSWRNKKVRILICFFIGALCIGTFRILTQDSYKKENVKDAIQFTNDYNKSDDSVVFLGYGLLANYYHLRNYRNDSHIEKMDSGFILFIKSMYTYYNMKDTSTKQLVDKIHNKELPYITKVWEDKDSELYYVKAH